MCHSETSPYHPQGNPAERFTQTLMQMLQMLAKKEQVQWKDHLWHRLYMSIIVQIMSRLGIPHSTCCTDGNCFLFLKGHSNLPVCPQGV